MTLLREKGIELFLEPNWSITPRFASPESKVAFNSVRDILEDRADELRFSLLAEAYVRNVN